MPITITLPSQEMYDERNNLFYTVPEVTMQLEHSLIAISKWEMKWKKPFLTKEVKSTEEFLYYVQCMTMNKVDPKAYSRLTNADLKKIQEYIDDPMTATTFHSFRKDKPGRETITSELVYYWMNAAQIPLETEKWHFNRLMTLIRIHSIKNDTTKMSKSESAKHQHAMNAARRAKRH